ncbi:MAG TPA: response regulator [Myxococcaceae bacterium]
MTPVSASTPVRILLVEDDEDDFVLVRDALRALSPGQMTLEWVDDAEQGLEAMAAGRHDVCLLDYRLGAYTGLEVLRQARERGVCLPVILLTGMSNDEVDREALEAGAADFLVKSQLTPELLQRSIRYTVQHSRTLQTLRRSQESFRALIEQLPEGFCVTDKGRIIYASPAFLRLIQCESAEELMKQHAVDALESYLHPEDLEALLRDLPGILKTTDPMPPREMRLVRKSGEPVPMEMARLPVMFDGQLCAVNILRDLTERKQMEGRLVLADRMASLGMLAGMIAHDINNPLAYVVANLHTLEAEVLPRLTLSATEQKDVHELVGDAQVGASRAREIVQQLRMFSFSDRQAPLVPLEVHRVLESALRLAGNELRHRARLVRDYREPLSVQGNEGQLGQVFVNLLVNAAQAIPEGAVESNEVRVVTRPVNGQVVIEVHDTGTGIPAERLQRVFEPFFTTKPAGVGTGLGLSICRDIIQGMSGQLEVESQVGHGSVFRVILPTAAAPYVPARQEPQPEPQRAPGRRGRILVVDDEPMVSQAIRRALQREHEVVTLTSAREAHSRLSAGEQFDLILCDLMMPEMSGMDLHDALTRTAPGQAARMVFLTGGAFTPKAREFLGQLKNPMVEKPFMPRELQALVRSLLSTAEQLVPTSAHPGIARPE